MRYDVAIVGLGAMGSAAAYALAKRGAKVIAFDQFAPPHSMGSSHGHTRIIREAYYEHPLYVPLVRRAYDLWDELAGEANASLRVETGGIMVGRENGPLVGGALESARAHGISHEMLDPRTLAERFPAYHARSDWVGLLETRAGMLFPEKCIEAMLRLAEQRGAGLKINQEVKSWRSSATGVTLSTTVASYRADRLIVAAGPWLGGFIESLGVDLPLEVERQLSHWFEPSGSDDRYAASRCPIGLWEPADGEVFATLPDEGHGVKCGMHHAGAPTSPSAVDRAVSPDENAAAWRLLEQVMPGAGGRLLASRVCLYTNTPDRHFIVDWLKGARVLVLSPCSGHGFKFATAIGEAASQLVLDGRAAFDLSPFSLSRFR